MHDPLQSPGGHDLYQVDPSVTGIFRDPRAVNRAVRGLTSRSVPVDAIRVFVVDESGKRRREVTVEDEAGALRGGLIGAGVGAAVGVGIVILVPLVYGTANMGFLGVSSFLDALRVIAICAAATLPLGAILGMGHWEGRKRIAEVGMRGGRIQVTVESAELAEVARNVLEDAGAERVEPKAVRNS